MKTGRSGMAAKSLSSSVLVLEEFNKNISEDLSADDFVLGN